MIKILYDIERELKWNMKSGLYFTQLVPNSILTAGINRQVEAALIVTILSFCAFSHE